MKIVLRNSSLVFEVAKPLVNYLNPMAINAGIYNGTANREYTNQWGYYSSDFIPVKEDGLIWAPRRGTTTTFVSYTVFDANKDYIRSVKWNEENYNKYTYQNGDAYIVVNLCKPNSPSREVSQEDAETVAVVEGDTYRYVPFIPQN